MLDAPRALIGLEASGPPIAARKSCDDRQDQWPQVLVGWLAKGASREAGPMNGLSVWARRHGDAIATVLLTVALVLAMPVDGWSVPRRLALFAGIVVAVPTFVCVASLVIARRRVASGPSDRSS